jgi:hypothetical protein
MDCEAHEADTDENDLLANDADVATKDADAHDADRAFGFWFVAYEAVVE